MDTKHTPGPLTAKYRFANRRDVAMEICNQEGTPVATVHRGFIPQEQQEANAALFIAAQDLLTALEAIATGNTMKGKLRWNYADVIQEHYRIARAAIAKATGQQ